MVNYFASPQEMKKRCPFQRPLKIRWQLLNAVSRLELGRNLFPFFRIRARKSRQFLRQLTRTARRRYQTISSALEERIEHELSIIEKLDVADYFLTV